MDVAVILCRAWPKCPPVLCMPMWATYESAEIARHIPLGSPIGQGDGWRAFSVAYDVLRDLPGHSDLTGSQVALAVGEPAPCHDKKVR